VGVRLGDTLVRVRRTGWSGKVVRAIVGVRFADDEDTVGDGEGVGSGRK
jgi:hypothetical protein